MTKLPRLLAEWKRQDAVLMSWPTKNMDWSAYLSEIHATYEEIILTLLRFVDVVLVTPPDSELKETFLSEARSSRFTFYRAGGIELNDTWIRDYGPLCVSDGRGKKEVVDFTFNGWGGKFAADKDNAFTKQFYDAGYFRENVLYRDARDFVFEGGAIDVSCEREGLTTRSVLTYPNRNKGDLKSQKKRIQAELGMEVLNILSPPPLEGDDTDGHVDTMTRFVGDLDLVTCVDIDPEEVTARYADIYIHKLPVPDPVIWEGEKKPATYANFLFTNGAIIVPTYGDPVHDKEALKILREMTTTRRVVGVDCRTLVRQNGSLHCATMQIPKDFLDKTKLEKA